MNEMAEPNLNDLLSAAATALLEAGHEHANAAAEVAVARRRETDALNRVNAAQKEFDALVALLKKEAPRDSDWRRSPGAPA